MQPKELATLISEITQELNADPIVRFLEEFAQRSEKIKDDEKAKFRTTLLSSYDGFVRSTQHPAKKDILYKLKVNEIYHPDRVAKLLRIVEIADTAPTQLFAQPQNATLFQAFISSLRVLKSYSDTFWYYLVDTRYPRPEKEKRVLDFEIVIPNDTNKSQIPVTLLISILKNIEELYSVVARIFMGRTQNLTVAFLESGSNIKISVEGFGDIIEKIGTLFTQIWQQVRFRDFDYLDRKLESTQKAIDLIVDIKQKQKNNEITGEDADKAIQIIWKNSLEVIKGGALPATAFESDDNFNTERLLAQKREVKQISAPQREKPKKSNDDTE